MNILKTDIPETKKDVSLVIDKVENSKSSTMKLVANQTMYGQAGFVKEGDVFETNEHHANELIKDGKASLHGKPEKGEVVVQKDSKEKKVDEGKPREKKILSDNPGKKQL